MTCRDVLDGVEAVAANEVTPSTAMRSHLEACPSCASALATARRVEQMLASRPAPPAPPAFTHRVQHRLRRERWRAEQQIDRIFNVAMAAAALLVIAGGLVFFSADVVVSGLSTVSGAITARGTDMLVSARPWLGTYVAATALLISAAVMWWWAETS